MKNWPQIYTDKTDKKEVPEVSLISLSTLLLICLIRVHLWPNRLSSAANLSRTQFLRVRRWDFRNPDDSHPDLSAR